MSWLFMFGGMTIVVLNIEFPVCGFDNEINPISSVKVILDILSKGFPLLKEFSFFKALK